MVPILICLSVILSCAQLWVLCEAYKDRQTFWFITCGIWFVTWSAIGYVMIFKEFF